MYQFEVMKERMALRFMASSEGYSDNAYTDGEACVSADEPIENNTPAADAAFMDAEICLVARFHALMVWRIFISAVLGAFMLGCSLWGLDTSSAVYILLFLNLLPFLLEGFCAPHVKKSVPVLPFLRKKYHYSSLRYATLSITFALTCLLLVLWQFHNSTPAYPAAWLYNFPAFVLAACFFQRAVTPRLTARRIRRKMGC